MNEKTVYTCTDQEENGWRFCPACGREIVIADETSELTKKQWGWILGRFSRAE